ncbi:MAG: ABC transporter ATP-binding protein [Proteobacteria bacterium]|nr:ABC transporter ATP-binding protein [Pseudomonadota bacterium]
MGETTVVTAECSKPVVQIQAFCKRYRKQVAVQDVDLEIQSGEIYGLIGPDGAGKSSLMKAIAGVLTFDGGSLEVFGIKVDSERTAELIKGRLGFMPQGLGLNLYGDLSVEENIDFFAQLRDVPSKLLAQRKSRLLAMTRLDKFLGRPMKQLSGGMKQKLGLVCTLIHEPKLVILDEPTTGVDPVSRRDFWAILTELLREQGITALVSTSYMDEATRFHRLSLLHDGQVLATGDPESILKQTPGSIVEMRVEPQIEAIDRLKTEFPQIEAMGPRLRVFVDDLDPDTARQRVVEKIADLQPQELYVSEPELEDVFVSMLHHSKLVATEDGAVGEVHARNDTMDSISSDGIAIEANNLTRDFDGFRAVDGVTFQVRQGEIFGLLGANGAGKTTVIRMLTGILPPTAGEGRVAGADMHGAGHAIKERIGYMSQSFSLYQDLNVLENIRLYAGVYGLSPRNAAKRTEWVLEMAGLRGFERMRAGRLPMGIRQRLALGCALVHQPRVLFLDEPTSGVDPIGRRLFWDILVRLSRQENVAVLVTTHYMSEAEHCDHLVLMYAGRVVEDATPVAMKQELQAEAGQLLEIRTNQPWIALDRIENNGYAGAALFGKRIHLFARNPEMAESRIRALLKQAGVKVFAIDPCPPTMEDVFVYRVLALEKQEAKA